MHVATARDALRDALPRAIWGGRRKGGRDPPLLVVGTRAWTRARAIRGGTSKEGAKSENRRGYRCTKSEARIAALGAPPDDSQNGFPAFFFRFPNRSRPRPLVSALVFDPVRKSSRVARHSSAPPRCVQRGRGRERRRGRGRLGKRSRWRGDYLRFHLTSQQRGEAQERVRRSSKKKRRDVQRRTRGSAPLPAPAERLDPIISMVHTNTNYELAASSFRGSIRPSSSANRAR
jgi:hypothetical protein